MRDFRDAKAMARTLRAALAAKGYRITTGESLELIAKLLGAADWNTLAAAIKAAPGEKPTEPPKAAEPPEPPDNKAALDRVSASLGWNDWQSLTAALRTVAPEQPGRVPPGKNAAPLAAPTGNLAMDRLAVALGWVDWEALSAALRSVLPGQPGRRSSGGRGEPPALAPAARPGGTTFSDNLTKTLHLAVALATERSHTYTTLEHLLLALTEDPDASEVMQACQVDPTALRASVTRYIDEDLTAIVRPARQADGEPAHEPAPTAGFHRVVQRSVIHVQSSGRGVVTGANLLVAIFSERESHAFYFLQQQKMQRFDAVNFIARGIRKGGGAAA